MVDFQTRIEIAYKPGMQDDFDDLRFTNVNNSAPLPYWIEYYEEATRAVVWLKTDSIPAFSSTDYYIYYANANADIGSNPSETFIYYDDFDEDNGLNDIGSNTSTGTVMYDSLTSTLQKYDGCGDDGSWISIGDTITSFKLITREFMPADTDTSCTLIEYGIESSTFEGINLRRQALDPGTGTEFGLELRNNLTVSDISTTIIDQPAGNWYRSSLSYSFYCHFNIHAMMFTDDMQIAGNVYSESFNTYDFDRFTMRGGHTYNLDYIAVAKHLCVWPISVFNNEIETCPQGTLVEYQHDRCEEGLGEITIQVSGGVAPYVVTWYDGQDSLGSIIMDTIGQVTIDSLSAGDYCFKVVDAEGCEN